MDATQKKTDEATQKQLDFIAKLTKQKDWSADAMVAQMSAFSVAPTKRGASKLISAMLDLEDKAAPKCTGYPVAMGGADDGQLDIEHDGPCEKCGIEAQPSAVSLVHQAITEARERRQPKEGECLILGQAECRLLLGAISTHFTETDGSVELHELDNKIREFLGMEPTALPEYLK